MSSQRAPVFEETYRYYLGLIGKVDIMEKAGALGVTRNEDALIVPFYDKRYSVSGEGIFDLSGNRTNPAVQVILGKYVLTCETFSSNIQDELKNYRDFKGSSPLHSYFRANATAKIESAFTGELGKLKERAESAGGQEMQEDCYDFSVLFYALPRIPVLLNYNDRDDLFPAACSILYRSSAEHFLDMECLAMTGTLLAERLTGSGD